LSILAGDSGMTAPRWLARFNRRVTNRLGAPAATRLPGFGLVEHAGRRTGRTYRTPVVAFRRGSRYVIAMPYGPRTDWAQNVLAAGGCTLATSRGRIGLTKPRLLVAASNRPVPVLPALILGLLRVRDFMELVEASGDRGQ
jgi:deazaflavin-dependent oxidoreductase (nitroreductase family)